jgi:hypothetical protein
MVANPRPERRNSADPIVNRLASMQRQIDGQSRRGVTSMWDGNSEDVVSVDQAGGWGLQNPILDATMYPVSPDAMTVTTAVLTNLWHAVFPVTHQGLVLAAFLTTKGAASVAGSMQWAITTAASGTSTIGPITQSGVGSVVDTETFEFAEVDQGQTALVQLQAQMTGTVVGGNYAYAAPYYLWRVSSTYTS